MLIELLDQDSVQVAIKDLGSIVYKNSFWVNLGYNALGVLGILAKSMYSAIRNKAKTISEWWEWMSKDSLILLYSVTCYQIMVISWWAAGIDNMGLYQDCLNITTIPLAFAAERAFATLLKEKKVEVEAEVPIVQEEAEKP